MPPDLVETFSAARFIADGHSSILEQATLADFVTEGPYARHLRRMRSLYAERQAVLVEAAQRELAGHLEIAPAATGMHLVGWLPEGMNDTATAQRAAERAVDVSPLSWYSLRPLQRGALLLGYGGVGPEDIRAGVQRLRQALQG